MLMPENQDFRGRSEIRNVLLIMFVVIYLRHMT
jgi:hypothetical protein